MLFEMLAGQVPFKAIEATEGEREREDWESLIQTILHHHNIDVLDDDC